MEWNRSPKASIYSGQLCVWCIHRSSIPPAWEVVEDM